MTRKDLTAQNAVRNSQGMAAWKNIIEEESTLSRLFATTAMTAFSSGLMKRQNERCTNITLLASVFLAQKYPSIADGTALDASNFTVSMKNMSLMKREKFF